MEINVNFHFSNNTGDQSSSVMLNAEEQAKSEEMFNRVLKLNSTIEKLV